MATSYSDWVNYAGVCCSLRIKWDVTDSDTSCTVKATLQRWDKYAVTPGGAYSIAMTSCTTSTGNSFPSSSSNNSTRNGKSLSHTYTKTQSTQTVTVTISTSEWFDTIADSGWTKIGAVSFSKTLTISKKTSYTVKYAANGGSSTPSNQTKWHGTALTLKGSISRANSSPGSYTVALNGNGAANSSLTATRTTTYSFSKWKATNGTTYNAGGSYTANAATTMTAQWSSSTTTAKVSLPTKTLSGYSFKQWNTAADGSGTGYSTGTNNYTPPGNVTLYAIWNRTVTYDENGGSGAPSPQTDIKTNAITISSTVPTRAGYRFVGWNTQQDGNGTSYASGATYSANSPTVTLYAQWQVLLTIDVASITRCTLNGTADPLGGYIKVVWDWANGAGGAVTPSFTVSTAPTTDTATVSVSTAAVSGTAQAVLGGGSISPSTSYTATVDGSISSGTSTASATLPITYTPPAIASVKTNRANSQNKLADDGEVLKLDVTWSVFQAASQRVTMSVQAVDTDGNYLFKSGGTPTPHVLMSAVANNYGGTSTFYVNQAVFSTDKQYSVTVYLTDAVGNGMQKGDTLSNAFYPMDILGDAYYYEPTEDASCDPTKTYYFMGDTGWYAKFEGSTFETGVTYYEKTGPKPGHGVSFGAPCKDEGFHVHMPVYEYNQPSFFAPIGTVLDYAGSTVPSGYLECNGEEYLKTDYPLLYAAIGDSWGASPWAAPTDSLHFRVPNLNGRVTIGAGTGTAGGATSHGFATGGGDERMKNHSHTLSRTTDVGISDHAATACTRSTNAAVSEKSITGQVAAYSDTGMVGAGTTVSGVFSVGTRQSTANRLGWTSGTSYRLKIDATHDHSMTQPAFTTPKFTHTITQPVFSAADTGGGNADNMQPFATLRKIIRAA